MDVIGLVERRVSQLTHAVTVLEFGTLVHLHAAGMRDPRSDLCLTNESKGYLQHIP